MKLFLLFLLLTLALASAASRKRSAAEEEEIAAEYFKKFNKNRGRSQNDFEKRKKLVLERFYENEEHNEKFNKGKELYEKDLNEFSDLTDEEFRDRWTGLKIPSKDELTNSTASSVVPPLPKGGRRGRAAPSYWNWAGQPGPVVQPVQNQGSCGACYAFAGVAAIEGSMCRYYNQCTKLSEQEAMECTNGCNGGFDHDVYSYSKRLNGCAYNYNYYYRTRVIKGCAANGARVPHTAVVEHYVLPNNAEEIKQFLYDYGPLWVAYYLYPSFNSYSSGIFTGCTGTNPGGHAVLITGYGEQNGVKYWIVKNSWGASWGENGYFRILRGNNCAQMESWRVSFPWTS